MRIYESNMLDNTVNIKSIFKDSAILILESKINLYNVLVVLLCKMANRHSLTNLTRTLHNEWLAI